MKWPTWITRASQEDSGKNGLLKAKAKTQTRPRLVVDGRRTAITVSTCSARNGAMSGRLRLYYLHEPEDLPSFGSAQSHWWHSCDGIYHLQIVEGDVVATIREHHQYIAHYHTCGVPGWGEIDATQEINYPAVMKAIVETGYKDYVAQEFLPKRPDPIASLRQGV